jgi:predicted nucleic acid-binding protein
MGADKHPPEDPSPPLTVLGDADLFFFYLRGGKLEDQASKVIEAASAGRVNLRTSSEVYDDAISALRADEVPLEIVLNFVSDMKAISNSSMPMSAEIAEDALSMYMKHGGRRKLSYFDSMHLATAKRYDLPFLTSDRYVITNAKTLGVTTLDLTHWEPVQ